jgi:hypothetical protein
MNTLTPTFPCYSGRDKACTSGLYEELLDRLAATIGMDHARIALRMVGAHAADIGGRQMLSSLLVAYGETIASTATASDQHGEHDRRSPIPVT